MKDWAPKIAEAGGQEELNRAGPLAVTRTPETADGGQDVTSLLDDMMVQPLMSNMADRADADYADAAVQAMKLELLQLERAPTTPADFVNNRFDMQRWWQLRMTQFPLLSAIARWMMAVPASSIESESFFSHSGMVVSARRARLTTENVQMLTTCWANTTPQLIADITPSEVKSFARWRLTAPARGAAGAEVPTSSAAAT